MKYSNILFRLTTFLVHSVTDRSRKDIQHGGVVLIPHLYFLDKMVMTFRFGSYTTFLVQGPSILDCDEQKKGLLPKVVDEIFKRIKFSKDTSKYMFKLSMVIDTSFFSCTVLYVSSHCEFLYFFLFLAFTYDTYRYRSIWRN